MTKHANDGGELKGAHKWTREGGYEAVDTQEESAEAIAASAPAPEVDVNSPEYKEAVEFVRSRGYKGDAPDFIVKEQGVATILASKAEYEAEEVARKSKPVEQSHIQVPGQGVTKSDAEPNKGGEEEGLANKTT